MSSRLPTSPRPARWRDPAGWPLRTRLVAIMITLLAVLGLAVGGTAEIYLHRTLYSQADTQLDQAADRRGPPGGVILGSVSRERRCRALASSDRVKACSACNHRVVGFCRGSQGQALASNVRRGPSTLLHALARIRPAVHHAAKMVSYG